MVDATSPGGTAAEVDRINRDVTGLAHGDLLPQQTAAGLASQSIAHSLALAVSNATTALRNVQTIMTTIQSVAMSRLLDDEPGERYTVVIRTATEASRDAARLWREVNDAAQQLLTTLPDDASTGRRQEPSPSPSPRKAAAGKKAAKTRARKKSAKKAAKTRATKRAAKTSTAPSGSR